MQWRKYWDVEPWGPWRENMHAAILARAILTPHLKKGAKVNLDDFMLMHPDVRKSKEQKQATQALMSMLRTLAQQQPGGAKRKRVKRRAAQ